MSINHQNNFATNLTSNTNAGVTTTPLNSIPTIDAPFYLALDATNINSHYEVIKCTSKTATNVLHAATTYAHTTDEEVRCIIPAEEMDNLSSGKISIPGPEGFLINGLISVADSSGITVAIKTLAGADPSSSDPVYCRINGTVRSITSALSVSKADGTNWCNAGSTELATKEIDYFVYLGYNATDGVVIGFSRYPGANSYDDFSTTTTNEKYCAISTITNAAATDYYGVIGRFAATLSAGTGYTWSVPTYTAKNLIQRPIYETRWLTWQPVYTCSGSMTYGTVTTEVARYRLSGNTNIIEIGANGTTGGTASSTITPSVPFAITNNGSSGNPCVGTLIINSASTIGLMRFVNTQLQFLQATADFTLGSGRVIRGTMTYEI